MYFKIGPWTLAFIFTSLVGLLWQSQGHPFAVLSVLAVLPFLWFRDRFNLSKRGVGVACVVALLMCFLCTRSITAEDTGNFLGIGTISLALLACWLLGLSLAAKRTGYADRAPILLAGALFIACSMSIDLRSVAVLAGVAILLLVLAMREAMGLRSGFRYLAPLVVSFSVMGVLAVAAHWSESKVSYLMGFFSLVPPSGWNFPATTSLNSLQRWNYSDVVVLRGYGPNPPTYLVGRTFSKFDDKSFWLWKTTKKELAPEDQILFETNEGPRALSLFHKNGKPGEEHGPPFRIEYPRPGNGLTFYLPREYFGFAADLTRVHFFSDGMVQALAKDSMDGEYYMLPYKSGWESGRKPAPLTGEERDQFLQLPDNLTPEVARLAEEVAGEVEDPRRKAEFVTAYLQQNFTYGYDYPFKSNQTALEEFLLKRPPVHCEFFATAAALMLRKQGVPTRYVNGFVLQEKALGGDYYVIRLKHAHAWIEAYLPGEGWVTFDPTPPGTLGDADDSASMKDAMLEWASNMWRRFLNFVSLSPQDMVARVKAFFGRQTPADYAKYVLLLAAVWLWNRYRAGAFKRKRKAQRAAPYAAGRDQRLTPLLERASQAVQPPEWGRRPSETPHQWLDRLRTSTLENPALSHLEDFVDDYVRVRFGTEPADADIERVRKRADKIEEALKSHTLSLKPPDQPARS